MQLHASVRVVMLDGNGTAKVAEFSSARFPLSHADLEKTDKRRVWTDSELLHGAPEQLEAKSLTFAVDVWGLGMKCAIHGRHPHRCGAVVCNSMLWLRAMTGC